MTTYDDFIDAVCDLCGELMIDCQCEEYDSEESDEEE